MCFCRLCATLSRPGTCRAGCGIRQGAQNARPPSLKGKGNYHTSHSPAQLPGWAFWGCRRCRRPCLCAVLCAGAFTQPRPLCRIPAVRGSCGVYMGGAITPACHESPPPVGVGGVCGFFKVRNSRGHTHSRGGYQPARLPFCTIPRPVSGGWGFGFRFAGVGFSVIAWDDIPALYSACTPVRGFVHPLLGGGVCVLCSAVKVRRPASGAVSVGVTPSGQCQYTIG